MLPAICLIGFLGSVLLLRFADKVNPANRYLAYHFFLNALFGFAHWASVINDSDTLRALFSIHYFPIYLLNTPFLYFYVRAVLTEKIYIERWDYVHFLPFLIVLFNIIPFASQSWAFKLNFAHQFHRDFKTIYQIQFPLIPFTFYFVGRSILSLIYIVMSAVIVWEAIKKGLLVKLTTLKTWLIVCLGLGAIFNLSLLSFSVYSLLQHDFILMLDEEGRGRAVATLFMSALAISIYFFPKVLYGLHFEVGSSLQDVIKLNEKMTRVARTPELSKARLKQVAASIEEYVPKKKFLTPGFSLGDLVQDLGYPEHVLTFYFNNYQGITFLKWKNQLRIEEAVTMIRSGDADSNTLESVGKACGYKSRSNFIQAFKFQTGESPSAYLKRLQ